MLKHLLSLFLSVWATSGLLAQWEQMNGPYGGFINDLAQNDHYQFAATPNGLFRSQDEGQTWQHLNITADQNFACLQVGIYGHNIITDAVNYTGAKVTRYLFKSEDNGENWRQINRPAVDWYLSIAFNHTHIYLTDQRDLWVSLDDGSTWNLSQINPALDYIWNLDSFDDHIYVNAGSEIFKSTGMFDDFNLIPLGDFGYAYSFFAMDSIYLVHSNNDNLYRSADGGLSWSNPLNTLDGYVNFTNNSDAIYTNNYTTIYKSDDYGVTWVDQKSKYFSDLAHIILATENRILSGSFYTGIQSSRDQGKTFEDSNFGLSACFVQSLAIHNDKLFTGSLYKGISGFNLQTETWDTTYSLNVLTYYTDIAHFSGNLLAIAGHDLYKSTDGGENWNKTSPKINHADPSSFFPFRNIILVGGTPGSYMLVSSNEGDSWIDYHIKVDGANVSSTYLFAYNDETRFVAKRKVLFRSDDLSATWDTSMNGLILETQFNFIDKLYAFHDTIIVLELNDADYVYTFNISFDNGHSWQSYSEGLPAKEMYNGLKAITKVGGILLGCMADDLDGVYVSFDSGIRWQAFNDGLSLGGVDRIIYDDTYLYAATSGQGVWRRKISDLYSVSTNSLPTKPGIKIYPNPTNGNIWFEMESLPSTEVNIIISTLQGQVVSNQHILYDTRSEINTDQLPSGTYILTVSTRDQLFSNTFIISR